MSDILAKIAAYKRIEVAARKAATSERALGLAMAATAAPRGFRTALARGHSPGRLALIAEIKKASPSKGLIRGDYDPATLARAYEAGGATCLSVLTDRPSFQGDDAHLTAARAACVLPCLRKDFLVDRWQVAESRALGADAILVILAMVSDSLAADLMNDAAQLGMDVLVETHDTDEIQRANALGATLIGVNNRDLRTFVTDLAITENLVSHINVNALIVTESGISTAIDAARMERAGAVAMLVGESLMRQDAVELATRTLLGPAPIHD